MTKEIRDLSLQNERLYRQLWVDEEMLRNIRKEISSLEATLSFYDGNYAHKLSV